MNLHITHDDKFLDFFIENQELYTNTDNRYIVYTHNKNLKLQFSKNKRIEAVYANLDYLLEKIGNLNKYRTIFVHYLDGFIIDFLNTLKEKKNIVWIFWGADGFNRIENYITNYCLEYKTKQIYDRIRVDKMRLTKNPIWLYKNFIRYQKVLKQKKEIRIKYLKAVQKINFFAHYIYDDYLLIKEDTKFNAEFVNFNYLSIKQSSLLSEKISNTNTINILIGNSATYTNNHIDVFHKLAKFYLDKIDKIFTPLSYGDPTYKNKVIKEGKLLFKERFIPLTNFIPIKDYNKLLSSIKIAIFGHIRSQAAGNILTLLLNGTKVYMNPKSNLYHFFKKNKVIIFDIDTDLQRDLEQNNIFLSKEIHQKNIKILNDLFGHQSMQLKYNNLLNL